MNKHRHMVDFIWSIRLRQKQRNEMVVHNTIWETVEKPIRIIDNNLHYIIIDTIQNYE